MALPPLNRDTQGQTGIVAGIFPSALPSCRVLEQRAGADVRPPDVPRRLARALGQHHRLGAGIFAA